MCAFLRLVLLLGTFAVQAVETDMEALPPSPGDPEAHPGLRIWEVPRFSHWPVIVYADEERNLAFGIPVPPRPEFDRSAGISRPEGAYHDPFGWRAGDSGTIGWDGGPALAVELPPDAVLDRVSGLLPLPLRPGMHQARLAVGSGEALLPLRVVEAAAASWPFADLRDGFPVDAEGLPVVLLAPRRDAARERQWALMRSALPRPSGRPLVVGDPLAGPGGDVFADLEAELRPAEDDRHPHHAALVALADLPEPLPRSLLWSPGNAAIRNQRWSAEEERVLGALRSRFDQLGVAPHCILLLPPLPPEQRLQGQARQRRDLLRRAALAANWRILDAAAVVGDPLEACSIAPGLLANHPVGAARERLQQAIVRALAE